MLTSQRLLKLWNLARGVSATYKRDNAFAFLWMLVFSPANGVVRHI